MQEIRRPHARSSIKSITLSGKKTTKDLLVDQSRHYKLEQHELAPAQVRTLMPVHHLEEDRREEFVEKDIAIRSVSATSMGGGRIIGLGNIISPDHFIVDDATPNYVTEHFFDKTNLLMGSRDVPNPTVIDGRVLVMSATYCNSYYHWLYHALPKGILLNTIPFDFIYVTSQQSFQKDYLQFIGVNPDRIIEARDARHILAKELIFTSYLSILPDRLIDYVRHLAQYKNTESAQDKRLYIARRNAPNQRNLLNEDEVFGMLKQWGFEYVELTGMPVAAQVDLFASASFIVGPHGAGMGNIIYCRPGTCVVELFAPCYVHPCMRRQASSLDLMYGYVLGQGNQEDHLPFVERFRKDMLVSPTKLEKLLIHSPFDLKRKTVYQP